MSKKIDFSPLFGGAARRAAPTRIDPALTRPGAKSRAEEEEENDGEGGNDDEKENPKPETGKRGKKAKKARRAEDDNDDEGGTDAEEGDDDTDAEDQDDDETAKARARERGRIAAIMSSNAAAGNPILALDLALNTRMTRNQVIGTLKRTGGSMGVAPSLAAAPISQLDARMGRERTAPVLSEDGHNRPDGNSVAGVAARLTARHSAMTGR
ncbi:hypothetical protein HW511_00270 [Asaia siamensis]|uniref:Uncharacterized protein n=1 Tax=Asaia siamensis TaxID=110479 RepID=A0ABQ1M814_9PROT|nr:hypothetical protein [Asaia siamensis]GBR06399.1 hypothetical protein AA0323_1380 [Asaia siamensis NRIC 0323]GGC34216.1 hypothetical protein GCM10007207_19710 [Asaia siamensis]